MISGNNFWDSQIKKDMTTEKINYENYVCYKNSEENMYQILKKNVVSSSDKIGIVDTNEVSYSYKQLLAMTDELSSYLVNKHNIKKGMHIGVLLYNSIEFVVVFLAAQKIGATIIPYPTKYRKPEITALIEKSDCNLLIVDQDYEWIKDDNIVNCNIITCPSKNKSQEYAFQFLQTTSLQEVEEVGGVEDKAAIMFTSGTTSFSKGVVIRNFNLQHAVEAYRQILNVNEKDTTILAIPIYNVTGLIGNLSLFLKCKATIYLHKYFKIQKFLTDLYDLDISFLHASPTIYNLMLKEKRMFTNLPALKTMACGSSNMPIEKVKELKEWLPGIEFRTIYGLSETSSPATIFPGDASSSAYLGSSGWPIPGLSIKIVNNNNEEQAYGNLGEIWVKGTNVVSEYYKIDSDSVTKDGWIKTGDIGYVNEYGYLYISDRKKDLINRGGENIFSIDIENAINEIEGVHEVAVIGVADELYGEVPAAILSVKKGYQLDESNLKGKLKKQIASYKIPVYFKFVENLQKTPNGKIDKKRLRVEMNEEGSAKNES